MHRIVKLDRRALFSCLNCKIKVFNSKTVSHIKALYSLCYNFQMKIERQPSVSVS